MRDHPVVLALPCVILGLAVLLAAGCDRQPTAPATQAAAPQHEHKAPHHGCLVELGEEFAHVELVLDAQTGALTAYSLDGEAEKPIRLKQPQIVLRVTQVTRGGKAEPATGPAASVELKGAASPLTGETVGDTSEFTVTAPLLKGAEHFQGTIEAVNTKGQAFANVEVRFPEGNEADKKK